MKRSFLCLLCVVLSFCGIMHSSAQKTPSVRYVEGVVRVKLQREVADRLSHDAILPASRDGFVTTGVAPLDRANQKVKAIKMTRVFAYSPVHDAKHKEFGLDLWYDIAFAEKGVNETQARNIFATVPGVIKAQRIPLYQLEGSQRYVAVAEPARPMSQSLVMPFNDPLLPDQWHYYNDGNMFGAVAGADINAFAAWNSGVGGSSDVLVAIIDGGFQVDHPDLRDNVFINQAELNGKEGVDDDGNGYIDDIYGYNFVINSANISAHEHGTHVAGTVGATNNNGVGVAGVAGGRDGKGGVKMLVCQVFDGRASGSLQTNFAGAIVYSADMGASIAQCSWGSSYPDDEDLSITEAIKYFTKYGGGNKMKGGLCIFAAGNTGEEGNYYPACLDDVLSVGAMTASKEPAYYSTYGQWVDVSAPGGLLDNGAKYGVLSTLPNSKYGYQEGTSMACPHVSGIAALVLSKYGNKDFSNETLRTLLTSSVNEMIITEPKWQGKFGSGYIDAYKALQVSEGSTPSTIADFSVTPSHDNALIEWVIPETEEKSVNHCIIYYSTEPITDETDLSSISSEVVDTKFLMSGDPMSYELTGLQPMTTYYFVIRAYNRWGTPSELSPVKTATTNAGPVAVIDNAYLSMNIDAMSSPVASTSFNIANNGEGILKYNISASTKSYNPLYPWGRDKNPVPGKVVPFTSKLSTSAVERTPIVTADYKVEQWPDTMTWSSNGMEFYLGELDKTLPNAMAQYFYVDKDKYPEGFNLTALNMGGLDGDYPVIEIYDGSRTISSASLIEQVEYPYFAYNFDIDLSNQLYFAPGSSFWVVVKFAPGFDRPLATGFYEEETYNSQFSFYSSDYGMTWTPLKEVVSSAANMAPYADIMTWDIRAISKNPDWSTVLNPQPLEGTVRAGESQNVILSNDGQKLVNGDYNFNLLVNTNETANPTQKLNLSLSVTGNKAEMISAKLVDFGNLLVGQEKTLKVQLINNGYGNFYTVYAYDGGMTCSSDQFQLSYMQEGISARSKGEMEVTFKPTKEGNFTGVVTIADREGNEHKFNVRGVASNPAHASLSTNEIDFAELDVDGEAKTGTFTITNDGNYPLQYVFPRFSDVTIEGAGKSHKFGYTYVSNLNGSDAFAYDSNLKLNGEVDITSEFNDQNWQSEPVALGFKFPFYGEEFDKVYITSHGSVMMNYSDGNIMCVVPTASCVRGLGYISAFANSGRLSMGPNSKISYGRQDDKFVVKYTNVLTAATDGGDNYTPISFRLALCPNGDIECYYDDYDPNSMFNGGQNLFVGVNNVEGNDPMVVYDNDMFHHEGSMLFASFFTGSAVKICAPAESIVTSISSTDGYIGIGETQEVVVTVKAGDKHHAGPITNNLTIVTNDPSQPSLNVALNATIVGEGLKPVASLDSTSVDFGSVFRTSLQQRTVMLTNSGRDILSVASVVTKNGNFTVDASLVDGFSIAAGHGKAIELTMNTANEGVLTDELVITYSDGTTANVALKGVVIGTPECVVDPSAIAVTTDYGMSVEQKITVTNPGNETLTVAPVAEDWYNINDLSTDENSDISYTFKTSVDGDVTYEWVDILSDYDAHMPMSYFLDKTDFYEVELPFEFPFYGKQYKTMYIYNTGFVSFEKPETDYKQFPEPPVSLPTKDTFYKNIIAPFWGNHSMDTPSDCGVYYKAETDHVVVSYHGYGNSVMMGMNFQVIINNDGTFKFQYKLDDQGMMIGVFGLGGIQDETAERGMVVPSMYIASGNAISFSPAMSYSIAPGESRNIDITVNADRYAGEYFDALKLQTNVPGFETIEVPATITINGEAIPVFPESVGGEAVADPMGMQMLDYEFEVKNEGTRTFSITAIEFNPAPDYWDPTFDWETYVPVNASLMVWSKYFDWLEGREIESWMPATDLMEPLVVGNKPLKFKVTYMDPGMVADFDLPITFHIEGLDEPTVVVPFNLSMTEAPMMVLDRPEIYIANVSDNYEGTEQVTISNFGEYKLTYDLRLEPSGRDEVVETPDYGGGGIAPCANEIDVDSAFAQMVANSRCTEMQPLAIKKVRRTAPYVWDVPATFDHTSALYYPIMQPIESAQSAIMGSGSAINESYYAATRFVAPAEGFNLSHVYFVGTVGPLENVDIEAEVVMGSDVTKMGQNTIARGKLRVEKEDDLSGMYYGEARILELEKSVYLNPTDTFYVVLKYPAGYGHSAVMASKDGSKSPNRYMGYLQSMGGWFDVEETIDASYGYGAFGYFMTCLETEKGSPWIKLLSSQTSGEVAPGESVTVDLAINAASTLYERNNVATLVIKTNDPMQKVVNYHIILDKNSAPVVTLPTETPNVAEGSNAIVFVDIYDIDADNFVASLASAEEYVSIDVDATTNSFGTTDGIVVNEDGTVNVASGFGLRLALNLAPEYGDAGLKSLVISATDEHGNARETSLNYNVEYVNRAPVYEGETELTLEVGAISEVFDLNALFSDPDDDAMTYTVSVDNSSLADVFMASAGFMLKGKTIGTATLTITATDAYGNSTTVNVALEIVKADGIVGVGAGSCNITTESNGELSVRVNIAAEKMSAVVYDAAGRIVQSYVANNVEAGHIITVAMPETAGVYNVVINVDGNVTVTKMFSK